MKVSIITPSIRPEGLEIVHKSIKRQTFPEDEMEWLVGSSFKPKFGTWVEDDFEGGFWTLNRVYNKLFKQAKGELIVSWQDNIWIPEDGIEKFWAGYEHTEGKALITGVGDQYQELNQFGKPHIKVWADPRKRSDLGSFYEVNFNDIEYNWGALPRDLVYLVGGADEELDHLGLGAEIFSIGDRLNDLGYKFFIDQTNESYSLKHGRRDDWDEKNTFFNGKYIERKRQLIADGVWPHLDYLQRVDRTVE